MTQIKRFEIIDYRSFFGLQLRCLYLVKRLYKTRKVDFRSRLTMSSGLAFGLASPASCISSKAKETLVTFSEND